MEHSAGRIVKNTIIFTAALLVQKIIAFGNFLYLSSNLSPSVLGGYVWALSFTTMFGIISDLGLSYILIRDASKDQKDDEKYFQNVLGLKLPLIAVALASCLIVLFATKSDPQVISLVLLSSALMVFDGFSIVFYSFLRAKQLLTYESLGVIGFQIISFAGAVIALMNGKNITGVMAALAFAGFSNLIYSGIVFRKNFKFKFRPRFEKSAVKYFFRLMPAFALSGIFVRIYNASDSVILGYMKGDAAVGLFSIPAKAVTAFQALIPGAFAATIYPSMANFYATSREKLVSLFEKSFNYLSLAAAPLAIGLYVIAEPVMKFIWPKYISAVPTFQVMALALPFIFLAFPTGHLLRACDKQNVNTVNRGIIMVLSVGLNLLLVYYYGVFGAGVTFLIVNIVLLIADLAYVGKVIDYSRKNIIWYNFRVLIASFFMAVAVILSLKYLAFYFAIVIGMIIFVLACLALGVLNKKELIFLAESIKVKKITKDEDLADHN